MITWKDFVLDDAAGPVLSAGDDVSMNVVRNKQKVCREKRFGSPSVMDDALGTHETSDDVSIQETGQEQRPARMVGLSSLDFAQAGKEASRSNRTDSSWQRRDR